jgi:outer membrane protein OmpA-like peptidoglycan-associated protein
LEQGHHNYVGPTKLALNIAYVFGKEPKIQQMPEPEETHAVAVAIHQPDFQLDYERPKAEAEKTRELNGQAFLDFVVNKTDIRRDYRRNATELAKVEQTINEVRQDPNTTITHIDIHGYASPEGSYQNNVRLAQGRAQAFKDYVQTLIDLPASIFTVTSTPEDWLGLIAWLDSNLVPMADAQAVRDIVVSFMEADQKEQLLKRQHPAAWRQLLTEVFPALRHSDYRVSYTVRPFSVEEARQLIHTKPQLLSLNEMFLVANTYTPGSQDFNEVFETAVRMYPDDETANLNAAVIALQKNDLQAAERYLKKAGNSPQALNARGVLAVRSGDKQAAERFWRQSTLPEAQHNLKELEKTF